LGTTEDRLGKKADHLLKTVARKTHFEKELSKTSHFYLLHSMEECCFHLRSATIEQGERKGLVLSSSPPRKHKNREAEKLRTQGDLVTAFQYLKRAYRKDGEHIFTRACCSRTRSNGFKLREGRFRLDIRKKFFTIRVVKH